MKILFVAQDPGGCESLVPIIKKILEKGHTFTCFASKESKSVLKKNKIEYIDADLINIKKLFNQLSKFKPDVIIASTSFGFSIDKKIISFAKSKKIKTISIVDYWSNYWQRFKDLDSGKKYLPDKICVVDKLMKKEMMSEGFSENIIEITGNPKFDSFNKAIKKKTKKNQILFVSQPLKNVGMVPIAGYDEIEVLLDLMDTLNRLKKSGQNFRLIIRPHPKENEEKFYEVYKTFRKEINIEIDSKSDITDLVSSSKLVIGMSSMILLNAALMGKPVISYQPNVKNDLSILDKLSISRTIKTKLQLYNKINGIINRKDTVVFNEKLLSKYSKNNSTVKVMEIINKLNGGKN